MIYLIFNNNQLQWTDSRINVGFKRQMIVRNTQIYQHLILRVLVRITQVGKD